MCQRVRLLGSSIALPDGIPASEASRLHALTYNMVRPGSSAGAQPGAQAGGYAPDSSAGLSGRAGAPLWEGYSASGTSADAPAGDVGAGDAHGAVDGGRSSVDSTSGRLTGSNGSAHASSARGSSDKLLDLGTSSPTSQPPASVPGDSIASNPAPGEGESAASTVDLRPATSEEEQDGRAASLLAEPFGPPVFAVDVLPSAVGRATDELAADLAGAVRCAREVLQQAREHAEGVRSAEEGRERGPLLLEGGSPIAMDVLMKAVDAAEVGTLQGVGGRIGGRVGDTHWVCVKICR